MMVLFQANILIDKNKDVKICDYGVSKILDGQGEPGGGTSLHSIALPHPAQPRVNSFDLFSHVCRRWPRPPRPSGPPHIPPPHVAHLLTPSWRRAHSLTACVWSETPIRDTSCFDPPAD